MKNLFKPLFALAIIATTFTSCMEKDNTDYDAINLKEEQTLDSILSSERTKIAAYVQSNFSAPVEDTVSFRFNYLNKTAKRGIWYQVITPATDNTYEYKALSYQQLAAPTVKLKYKAMLLNGTVVQSDEQGSTYAFNTSSPNIFNNAWFFSFFPYAVKFNGQDVKIGGLGGLTREGLKKGSVIRVVTPSIWAFGSNNVGQIPANSPLVYEFEVMTIE